MKPRAVGLPSFLMLTLTFGACSRDTVTGVPSVTARSAAGPKKLQDAIAFFTRQFSPVDGGIAGTR